VTPDGIGDACQCGDATGNGIVNGQDANAVKRAALGYPSPASAATTLWARRCRPIFDGEPRFTPIGSDANHRGE
jgi:hypothetical protein